MKKILMYITILAVMLFSAVTSYAQDYTTSYIPGNNKVISTNVSDKYTVMIIKGANANPTDDNIVYVNESDNSPFNASMEFFIKESPSEGIYTIMLGGENSNDMITETFCIGVGGFAGDIPMQLIAGEDGMLKNEGSTDYGYTATVTGAYNSVIVKYDSKYVAINIPTMTSGEGSATMGIQINVPSGTTIEGVWLSTRRTTINEDKKATVNDK